MKQKQSLLKGERQIQFTDGEFKIPLSVCYVMRKKINKNLCVTTLDEIYKYLKTEITNTQ